MAGSFLRLELDDSGIKAMIVELGYKKVYIKDNCHVLFKDLSDEGKKDIDPFDAGMDRIAQLLDITACSTAVIFVSPRKVSFRNIDLPFNSEKKIKQVLPFELETLLPGINKTYISDSHLLNHSNETNMILSASIDESLVETYFSKLDSMGIKPRIIAPGGYAEAVGFLKERKDMSTFAFLHIADNDITLVLINNQKPCAVRSFLPFSGSPDDLAVAVKQTIIGFNQRAGTKILFDVFISSVKGYPGIDAIYDALKKILEYPSGVRSLEQDIRKALIQEKINAGDLLLNISPDKTIKYLFNFCKGKYGTSSFFKTYFSNIAVAATFLFCVLSLWMLTTGIDNSSLERKIAAIDNRALSIFTTTFPDKRKIQDPYLQMKANVRAAVKKSGAQGNKGQLNKNIKAVDIMSEVSRKITSSTDMEISRFLFNNGRLVLSGSTDNFNTVDNIKSRMESSDLFGKVSISSAAADKKGDRVNFKFIIEI